MSTTSTVSSTASLFSPQDEMKMKKMQLMNLLGPTWTKEEYQNKVYLYEIL